MNNKVNVLLIVPEIEQTYNLMLPINKRMGTITMLLCKSINELSNGDFPLTNTSKLYNAESLETYDSNLLLYSTNIRNSTRLILVTRGC